MKILVQLIFRLPGRHQLRAFSYLYTLVDRWPGTRQQNTGRAIRLLEFARDSVPPGPRADLFAGLARAGIATEETIAAINEGDVAGVDAAIVKLSEGLNFAATSLEALEVPETARFCRAFAAVDLTKIYAVAILRAKQVAKAKEQAGQAVP